MRKRVVLLGKGDQAIRIAAWFQRSPEYDLIHVVPVVPEPSWTDSLIDWCSEHNVSYVSSGDYRDIPGARAETWRVDLVFSVFYSMILPAWFTNRSKRCLNLHNAPLPRYRGVAPINWALKNQETMHGVTIHEMKPRVDAGPIVAQVLFSTYPEFDEVMDVYRRALKYGYALFEQTMPILDRIEPVPQEEADATYYSRQDQQRLGDRSDFTRARSLDTTAKRVAPVHV